MNTNPSTLCPQFIRCSVNNCPLDSKVLKELTEALARLETIEQKLSGRASPGALRPRTEKQSRSRPAEPEPMPEDSETPGE